MTFLFLTAELTNSATGYCAKAVANELAKRGHYVHILSANKEIQDTIEYDGHLIVHEISGDRFKLFWKGCLSRRNRFVRFVGVLLSMLHKVLVQLKGLFSIVPVSNDKNTLFKNASHIIDGMPIHCIIPVVNPRESVLVAHKLYKKYHIPYIPYYLDSMYGNIGFRFLSKRVYKRRVLQYEDKWIADAKRIIMMQSVKGLYDAISPVQHPYISKICYLDIPLLIIQPKTEKEKRKAIFDNQFVVLFIGTMPNRIRDPRYVFELASEIAKGDVHFYFAGKSDYMGELNALMTQNGNVHFLGQIEHDDVPNYVESADILLNIGNSISGMLPSKVFEYMSYQKPILSTIKNSEDLSVTYLKQYGAVLIINENKPIEESVKEVLLYICQIMDKDIKIDVTDMVSKDGGLYRNTPTFFCEKVEEIMSLN